MSDQEAIAFSEMPNQPGTAKGIIEFYYNNEIHSCRQVLIAATITEFIKNCVRQSRNLKGEKYFVWKPS